MIGIKTYSANTALVKRWYAWRTREAAAVTVTVTVTAVLSLGGLVYATAALMLLGRPMVWFQQQVDWPSELVVAGVALLVLAVPVAVVVWVQDRYLRRFAEAVIAGEYERRCPRCDYSLHGVEGATCPECGADCKDVTLYKRVL